MIGRGGCDLYASDDPEDYSDCGKPASHIRSGLRMCDEHAAEWDDPQAFVRAAAAIGDKLPPAPGEVCRCGASVLPGSAHDVECPAGGMVAP